MISVPFPFLLIRKYSMYLVEKSLLILSCTHIYTSTKKVAIGLIFIGMTFYPEIIYIILYNILTGEIRVSPLFKLEYSFPILKVTPWFKTVFTCKVNFQSHRVTLILNAIIPMREQFSSILRPGTEMRAKVLES